MGEARNLGDLKRAGYRSRSVKEEMRSNLIARLSHNATLFPGILGYDETVVPALIHAILARHSIVLLGLRGQAKSRLARSLTTLLDAAIPAVAGCEIRDDPLAPLCRRCRDLIAERGDETPIVAVPREDRFVEKLATPDVTVADIIGDIDPIRAAKGGHDLASELTMHYGLLPRAHRGLFVLNELPDLAGRIQVALFNMLQEGDVQIKGYPLRLPLDVCLVFTANPEDYTARGKIITPLKDRLGSEIRTHYPRTLEQGIAITQQEAWTERSQDVLIPRYMRELVESLAFAARRSKKIDKRSGVSQRLPISTLELIVSSAERRALLAGERPIVPRLSDLRSALPAITGKLELEYEGELMGANRVVDELIREALVEIFSVHMSGVDWSAVTEYFEKGGSVRLASDAGASEVLKQAQRIPGLIESLATLGVDSSSAPPLSASAVEFALEGLWAHKKIGRSEEQGYTALERPPEVDVDLERLERLQQLKRRIN